MEDWNEASEIRHLLKDVLRGHWKRRTEDEEKKRARKRVAVRIMASEDTHAGLMEFFRRNLGEPSRMLGLKNAVYVEVFCDTMRFEVRGLILRVLDAFRPRGATWSGQVISSRPGPSGGPSKTHLLPGGGVPRVHRARIPVLPRLPRFATPRSVHQFAAVAAGAYPLRHPPNAWSPGAPVPPGPCYWLVASGTPLGWRGGCLA